MHSLKPRPEPTNNEVRSIIEEDLGSVLSQLEDVLKLMENAENTAIDSSELKAIEDVYSKIDSVKDGLDRQDFAPPRR
mgnify:CR=1 FL=1|jgi:hypothetical protein